MKVLDERAAKAQQAKAEAKAEYDKRQRDFTVVRIRNDQIRHAGLGWFIGGAIGIAFGLMVAVTVIGAPLIVLACGFWCSVAGAFLGASLAAPIKGDQS